MSPPSTLRHAWSLVIAAGTVMGLALGIRHAQGLFLQPISLDRQWPTSAFAFAIATQNLVWGLTQPAIGMLADRFGAEKVVFGGMVLYGAGMFLMADSYSEENFVWSNVIVGVALSGTAFGTVFTALSRLVPADMQAWTMSSAGAIAGVIQFCIAPATQVLLDHLPWTTVCTALAIVMVSIAPAALLMQGAGASRFSEPQDSSIGIGQALRHPSFWLLNVGFLACGFQLAFIAAHLPSYLVERGLTAHQGATAIACIALANVLGMYLAGRTIGVFRSKNVLAGIYLLRVVATLMFMNAPISAAGTYLFALIMGLTWLATAPLTNNIVVSMFGVGNIGALFGIVFFSHQLGSFLGVWLGGEVYDIYRSYAPVWNIAIVIGLLSAALHVRINDVRVMREPQLKS